jgi:hypothetical protein
MHLQMHTHTHMYAHMRALTHTHMHTPLYESPPSTGEEALTGHVIIVDLWTTGPENDVWTGHVGQVGLFRMS